MAPVIELTRAAQGRRRVPIELMLSPLESPEGTLVTTAIRDYQHPQRRGKVPHTEEGRRRLARTRSQETEDATHARCVPHAIDGRRDHREMQRHQVSAAEIFGRAILGMLSAPQSLNLTRGHDVVQAGSVRCFAFSERVLGQPASALISVRYL